MLVLWSVLLTPVQLLFSTREERKPNTAPQVLWNPVESAGIKRASIKAEYVSHHALPETWKKRF